MWFCVFVCNEHNASILFVLNCSFSLCVCTSSDIDLMFYFCVCVFRYVERKNFLERVDHRQFELEKAVRLSNMKQ